MRKQPWWEERIIGAFMSYWIYQHLGNLSPEELEEDTLFELVRKADDAGRALRDFAYLADHEVGESRWSFHRDFGKVRLIMMDSRAGRVLKEGHRSMLPSVMAFGAIRRRRSASSSASFWTWSTGLPSKIRSTASRTC